MKEILKGLYVLYFIYAVVWFLITLIVVFPFALIASVFGRINGGNAIFRICSIWSDVWFFLIGIHHINIYEQPVNKNEQRVYIANHISYLDAAVIVKTFRMPIRPLGKYEMSRIPIFGFIYKRAVVMVDRNSAERRAKSLRQLRSILRRGISIFIFPEGTFNMTEQPLKEFFDGAFRLAIETRTPIRPVLFLDTYRRMPYDGTFGLNPGRSRAVFLKEVPVNSYELSDIRILKNKVYDLMENKLMEYGGGK